MMLQKTELEKIYKEESSGGLINQDNDGLLVYKKRKQVQRDLNFFMETTNNNQKKIIQLESNFKDINTSNDKLKNEMSTIQLNLEFVKKELVEIKSILFKITHK